MKHIFLSSLLLLAGTMVNAQQVVKVNDFIVSGPFKLVRPLATDTVDVNGKKLDFTDGFRKELKFYINNADYVKGKLLVKGAPKHEVLLDGKPLKGGALALEPNHHEIVVKYSYPNAAADSIQVSIDADRKVSPTTSAKRPYTLHDVLDGQRVSGSSLSPDGKFVIITYSNVLRGGQSRSFSEVKELSTGRVVDHQERLRLSWMPRTVAYYYVDTNGDNRMLYQVNPQNGARKLLASHLPKGSITFSPTEDYLIMSNAEEGPKEKKNIFQVLEPDDRQPGWRSRSYLSKFNLQTGELQRITFGNHSAVLNDITADGKTLLISVSRSRLTKRPTTVTDYLLVDAATLKSDTLMLGAEFLGGGKFSPDGKQLLFSAPAEAFDGIGKDPEAGKYSSMYDIQLFIYDLATRKARPLTRYFNPSVDRVVWSKTDGQIYFSANDRDYVHFYTLNPKNGHISQLPTSEDVMSGFSLASTAPVVTYHGVSTSNPVRLYTMNLKNRKTTLLEDCAATLLKDIELGDCRDFNFVSSRGDTIYGRYYLPPHFDASKKYPVIVNYYGGCTPTERNFETRYPQNYYAALGYIVYVVNPSGACGFGQKHSARHVNTWGKFVADDIIEGVKKFCAANSFVDAKKVGCIGASYGGFTTQYLQTVTDIFACAVSHAGISNITSYWGEGYWGYSYGEVASADSYPWNNKEMYTEQSPLFHADKIHTPLLLTHGTGDTNVPPIESIQMFQALKLLGREVALVQVQGENHWILDYNNRIQWSDTIMAWFEKYLKGNSTWWDSLYPEKHL